MDGQDFPFPTLDIACSFDRVTVSFTYPCDSVPAAFLVSVRNIQTGNKAQLLTVLVTNHQDYFTSSHAVLKSNVVIFLTDVFQLNHPRHWTLCSERVWLMLCPRSDEMLTSLRFGFKDP